MDEDKRLRIAWNFKPTGQWKEGKGDAGSMTRKLVQALNCQTMKTGRR
jgi:hypothetical protein